MYFVMHTAGIPFNGDTIKTKSLGGSETAAYYMAKELAALGHRVTHFTNSQEAGTFDGVKYEWVGDLSNDAPLGDRFTFYAENTPHDVLIIQRDPRAFARKYASKLNYWWVHDIAQVRNKGAAVGQLWNVDRILCVSEFHKAQLCKAWDIDPGIVTAITNGVDLALFTAAPNKKMEAVLSKAAGKSHRLVYSSRPERGLANLVDEGGIMEKLAGEPYHLFVCGYDNTTPDMREFYEHLWARCEALPNVTNLGALTKVELAQLMRTSDAVVYPTSFEEVSCITAMECMAAGTLLISSDWAALPETCKDSGSILLPLKNGEPDVDLFVSAIKEFVGRLVPYSKSQTDAGARYSWDNAANAVLRDIAATFAQANDISLLHHFMRHSDIAAFDAMTAQPDAPETLSSLLKIERNMAYKFYDDDTFSEHYKAYYQYEKDRGVIYGKEGDFVTKSSRYLCVASIIADLPDGSTVLDYGCAHGHYTNNLAKQFPKLKFVGADIAQSNIDIAQGWATDDGIENVEFLNGECRGRTLVVNSLLPFPPEGYRTFDAVIAAEVIEHVANPQALIDGLAAMLNAKGKMIITTPYGSWEAQGYREQGYWRAHLHHLERADIVEMVGHHPGFRIMAAPAGRSKFASVLGSYIYSFNKPTEPSRAIKLQRKLAETMPDQTVTACLIVKDAEADILKCLMAVAPFVQEVVIGIDASSSDKTQDIIRDYAKTQLLVPFNIFTIPKVSETGFAAARNATIMRATCDWVMWIDSDEVLIGGERMQQYLRHNTYNGYAVKQHHLSMEPMKVIKVDLPCRLFRNHIGVKFFGIVHEHPELVLNEGLGPVSMMPGVEILHLGYQNEMVRRQRFDRNIDLLIRDRKENPERVLGKFLWIRDLAQMCQYDAEAGKVDKETFMGRAHEGVALWRDLLATGNNRITVDALPYYSLLVEILGGGFDFSFKVAASKMNGGAHLERADDIEGHFETKEDAFELMRRLSEDKLGGFESRYF